MKISQLVLFTKYSTTKEDKMFVNTQNNNLIISSLQKTDFYYYLV